LRHDCKIQKSKKLEDGSDVGIIMNEDVEFLRERAAALRGLAQRAPAIADSLRRLAAELETKAAELERDGDKDRDGADA
jgi:hypothetical protein